MQVKVPRWYLGYSRCLIKTSFCPFLLLCLGLQPDIFESGVEAEEPWPSAGHSSAEAGPQDEGRRVPLPWDKVQILS